MEERKVMTELDLVELSQKGDKVSEHKLWEIYTPLVYKKYFELLETSRSNKITVFCSREDYISDAYVKFVNQLSGIRVAELRQKGYGTTKDWKLYCRLEGYLRSMNRDKRNHAVKLTSNECQTRTLYDSDMTNVDVAVSYTESYEETLKKQIFGQSWNLFLKRLNKPQRDLFEAQQKIENTKSGKPNYRLLKSELGLSKRQIDEQLSDIKTIFCDTLKEVSIKNGYNGLDYSDFLC